MKIFIKICNFILCILFFGIIFWSIYFMLNFEIEENIKTKLKVKNLNHSIVYVNSNIMYKLNNYSKVVLKLNNNYYDCIITKITWNNYENLFEIELSNLEYFLIPNSVLDVNIILGKKSIFALLFSSI